MFEGQAEQAMNFYISLFPGSGITHLTRNQDNENGTPGNIMHAIFSLNGQTLMCIDSPAKHAFTFTPAMSLHVTCGSEDEIDQLFGKLSEGGKILMPLNPYPFSKKYAWLSDKFGVSWQLNYNP